MEKIYDYMFCRDHIDRPGGAVLLVTDEQSTPLMDALLALHTAQPKVLDALVDAIPTDGLKALDDISQFLQDSGYEDASKFLDCSLEL